MKTYLAKNAQAGEGKKVALEDMILTETMPTTGGSKMLEGYMSLFGSTAEEKLAAAGYAVAGKVNVGEMGYDLLGETSFFGACENNGVLTSATALVLDEGEVQAVVGLDINGTQRRAAAVSDKVCVKPTYGVVSRFGTIAIACSGETVCVTANDAPAAAEVLAAMVGTDANDGTSLPQTDCERALQPTRPIKRVAVAKSLVASASDEVQAKVAAFQAAAASQGIGFEEIDDAVLYAAYKAWNICLSAELCNNVSRFDGVKYGYRTPNYTTIGELYTNSRTEAFGPVLKSTILYGSECLAEDKYLSQYDKALRVRRVVAEKFAELFASFDAVLIPACAKAAYTLDDVEADKYLMFEENRFTAPAQLTGLPAVVCAGVQLVGPAFSDASLLRFAEAVKEVL